MGKSTDVLKDKDAEFHVQQKAIITNCNANDVAWALDGVDVTAERGALTAAGVVWDSKFADDINPGLKNTVTTTAKNLARTNLETLLRPFIQRRIRGNTLITETDLVGMVIKPLDLVRTDAEIPDDVPHAEAQPGPGNSVHVSFGQENDEEGHESRGLPEHIGHCEFKFRVGNDAPATPKDCNETVIAKKSPLKLSFAPDQAGQRVYLFPRWVNTRNEPSPNWGARISIIIPGT